jgi:hypothetical protein
MEQRVYRGRIPTESDVQKLREKFPIGSLSEGLLISHERLEEALGLKRSEPRYGYVIRKWAAERSEKDGLMLKLHARDGVRVLTSAENVAATGKCHVRAGRVIVRGHEHLSCVRPTNLNEIDRAKYDHQRRAHNLLLEAAESANKLLYELPPVQSLPRPKLEAGA